MTSDRTWITWEDALIIWSLILQRGRVFDEGADNECYIVAIMTGLLDDYPGEQLPIIW